jgi:membrane-associated protease RseP (regulator of RpoE activity)
MRRALPPWAWLLVIAILFMGGMLWMRVRPPAPKHDDDPLVEAADDLERVLGLQVDPQPQPGGGAKPGTPAEQLGIQAGDRIVACGSQSVWHTYQLAELLSQSLGSGYPVSLLVEREGTYRQVVLGPGRRASAQPPAAAGP